jgi:hypothetical protein
MPRFLVLPGHTSEGKPGEFVVNLDQITRVLVAGAPGSVEGVQVFFSDGFHFTLKEKAAADFFDLISLPDYGTRPHPRT